jgi:hypothetical protein
MFNLQLAAAVAPIISSATPAQHPDRDQIDSMAI